MAAGFISNYLWKRIRSEPGNMTWPLIISPNIQPMDQMSTVREENSEKHIITQKLNPKKCLDMPRWGHNEVIITYFPHHNFANFSSICVNFPKL